MAAIEACFPQLATSQMVDDWSDQLTERLAERFKDLPCPALNQDGCCAIYAYRPLTCRSMGIPPDQNGYVEGACEIQTAVPIIRLSPAFREEEDRLAGEEAQQLTARHRMQQCQGEELLLPYAFLSR